MAPTHPRTSISKGSSPPVDTVQNNSTQVSDDLTHSTQHVSMVDSTNSSTDEVKSVWEFPNIEKIDGATKSDRSWKCLHCGKKFKGWNSTKVILHLVGKSVLFSKQSIEKCHGKINDHCKQLYARHVSSIQKTMSEKRERSSLQDASVKATQNTISTLFENMRSRSSSSAKLRRQEGVVDISGHIESSNESSLSSSIADMIHSCGLPFSLVDDPRFHRVLSLAKTVSSSYKPPNRNQISGDLLKLNYECKLKEMYGKLKKDAEIFGLCWYGDGATRRKSPLLNILASGAHCYACTLDIVDCTKHLEAGGKKDAKYIATLFLNYIEEIDPHKEFSDLFLFDGASNVQTAGHVLNQHVKGSMTVHGAEHVVSLFFSDLANKISSISRLIKVYKTVYSVFGSGSMHAPYALFQKNAMAANNGRKIGLIRAADTRMAGYFIALHRALRLRSALVATVNSVEFQELKNQKKPKVKVAIDFVLSEDAWKFVYQLLKCVFPCLRVLRLADSAKPGMDKLFYFVSKTDQALEKSKRDLDGVRISLPAHSFLQDEEDGCFDDNSSKESLDFFEDDESSKDCQHNFSDESDSEDDFGHRGHNLSDKILDFWLKRRQHLVHDMAIAGYLCSPVEEVRSHVKSSLLHDGACYTKATDNIISMIFSSLTLTEKNAKKELFWREFANFRDKTGPYEFRPYIWNSDYIQRGDVHLWHREFSYPSTKVFGIVACRVTSKILGIGSAERSWGAVAQIKDGKRSKISTQATKRQAVLLASASIERARIKHKDRVRTGNLWSDEDVAFDLELEKWDADLKLLKGGNKRKFHAWEEDWEGPERKNNHPVAEARFLAKYGGLRMYDVDNNNKLLTIDRHSLKYYPRHGGWNLRCYDPDGNEDVWEPKLAIQEIIETPQTEDMNLEIIYKDN